MTALMWVAAVVLIFAAAMLIAGVGEAGIWIAIITLGVAFVVIERTRGHRSAST